MLFSTNECLKQPIDLVRLWMHEAQRVYGDKLVDEKDIENFTKILHDTVKKHFEVSKLSRYRPHHATHVREMALLLPFPVLRTYST